MGDRVAVLDNAAPYVRIFDAQGRFLSAAIPHGENPGETRRPFSIAAAEAGRLLLAHHRGLEWIEADGGVARSLPLLDPALPSFQQAFQSIGAVEACGDVVVQLWDRTPPRIDTLPSFPAMSVQRGPASIVRMRADGAVVDTLISFAATRRDSRTYYPWLLDVQQDRLLLYTEETDVHRLAEIGCDGRVLREIPIDSLGTGERAGRTDRGFAITNARAPYAAGIVRIQNHVVWATRVAMNRQGGGQDSLTIVTAFEEGRPTRRIAIQGWFQLFDSRADGTLLVGNSWQHGMNWAATSPYAPNPAAVFAIDGNNLIDLIDQRGITIGPVPD
jgi:hypothetical protein